MMSNGEAAIVIARPLPPGLNMSEVPRGHPAEDEPEGDGDQSSKPAFAVHGGSIIR